MAHVLRRCSPKMFSEDVLGELCAISVHNEKFFFAQNFVQIFNLTELFNGQRFRSVQSAVSKIEWLKSSV